MATVEEVKKLSELARIRVGDEELEKFTKEFDAILDYVGQLEKLNTKGSAECLGNVGTGTLRNVMRADGEPNTAGAFTEKIVEQFSAREGNALLVKQIINHEDAE